MQRPIEFIRARPIACSLIVAATTLCGAVTFADIISGASAVGQSTHVTITQLTIAEPAGVAQGDLMLANIAVIGGTPVTATPPTGWTLIARTDNDTETTGASYWKVAGASEPSSYTWTIDNQTRAVGGITRYTGVDTANPIDAFAGAFGSTTTAIAPSITTSAANEQIVTLFAFNASTSSTADFTTPTGMTEKYETAHSPLGPSLASYDMIQSAAGSSGTKSSSLGRRRNWVAQQIALRPVFVPTAAENFDSYTLSSSLSGLNGGVGWSSGWTKTSGANDYVIGTPPAGGQGGNAAEYAAGFGDPDRAVYYRPMTTGVSSGTFAIRAYITTTSPNGVHVVALKEDNCCAKMSIYFDTDGHLKRTFNADASGTEDLGPYSANTWYDFRFNFDNVAHPGQYRVSTDGGSTYSGWQTVYNGGTYSAINVVGLESWFTNTGEVGWWDDIRFL